MKLAAVIMAAGKGKRMKNPDKSKVMFELGGKPMIHYVVKTALHINASLIVPIVGHQKQSVIDFLKSQFKGVNIAFAHQDEQLGTGHAVMQAEDILKDFNGLVMILSGDVPLLKSSTLKEFIKFHNDNNFDASLISAIVDNPEGYGRILRKNGEFFSIKEDKDCTEAERKVNEINSGIYLIGSEILFPALKKLSSDNVQNEYYLTDIFTQFKADSMNIGAFPIKNILEITGVNTLEQLKELEKEIVNE